MTSDLSIKPIGTFRQKGGQSHIVLAEAYAAGLKGLQGFGHVQVLWWFSQTARESEKRTLWLEDSPYVGAPRQMGTFATRSPVRPNPLALSCVEVLSIDLESGVLAIAYTDAEDGSPVLDIKPYTPSLDRVETPRVPGWCGSWPLSVEASGMFDWGSVFRF